VSAGAFPVLPGLSDPGERVQSLTYRESYAPVPLSTVYEPPTRRRLLEHAPALLRRAAGGAWALVSFAAAGPGDGQYRLRGMEPDRLWSRLPERTSDPIASPDGAAIAAAPVLI
jgi:hypothetical protein